MQLLFGLLICSLISKNQGLEKSRFISNPRKNSGSANLDFFPGLQPEKKLGSYYKPEKIQGLQNLKFLKTLIFRKQGADQKADELCKTPGLKKNSNGPFLGLPYFKTLLSLQ